MIETLKINNTFFFNFKNSFSMFFDLKSSLDMSGKNYNCPKCGKKSFCFLIRL